MAYVTLHRTTERRHLTVPLRVERLEEDADTHEAMLGGIDKKLNTLNSRALGILVSLVVASIGLALNLVVR